MRGCPSIGKWLNKLWYLSVMEYYCAQRNNEVEEFHVNWKDPPGIDVEQKVQNQEKVVHRD